MPLMTEHRDHRLNLAAEILRAGGVIRIRGLGASMLPSIWPGDVLVIESTAGSQIIPGEIVLVERDARFFVHRLVKRLNSHCITRGDSVPQNDPPVDALELLGRVAEIHRKRRVIIPEPQVSLTVRALGWMLCHYDLLRNLALRIHAFQQNRSPGGTGHTHETYFADCRQ